MASTGDNNKQGRGAKYFAHPLGSMVSEPCQQFLDPSARQWYNMTSFLFRKFSERYRFFYPCLRIGWICHEDILMHKVFKKILKRQRERNVLVCKINLLNFHSKWFQACTYISRGDGMSSWGTGKVKSITTHHWQVFLRIAALFVLFSFVFCAELDIWQIWAFMSWLSKIK